jgi:hypothetical protein
LPFLYFNLLDYLLIAFVFTVLLTEMIIWVMKGEQKSDAVFVTSGIYHEQRNGGMRIEVRGQSNN